MSTSNTFLDIAPNCGHGNSQTCSVELTELPIDWPDAIGSFRLDLVSPDFINHHRDIIMTKPPFPGPHRIAVGLFNLLLMGILLFLYDIAVCLVSPVSHQQASAELDLLSQTSMAL